MPENESGVGQHSKSNSIQNEGVKNAIQTTSVKQSSSQVQQNPGQSSAQHSRQMEAVAAESDFLVPAQTHQGSQSASTSAYMTMSGGDDYTGGGGRNSDETYYGGSGATGF